MTRTTRTSYRRQVRACSETRLACDPSLELQLRWRSSVRRGANLSDLASPPHAPQTASGATRSTRPSPPAPTAPAAWPRTQRTWTATSTFPGRPSPGFPGLCITSWRRWGWATSVFRTSTSLSREEAATHTRRSTCRRCNVSARVGPPRLTAPCAQSAPRVSDPIVTPRGRSCSARAVHRLTKRRVAHDERFPALVSPRFCRYFQPSELERVSAV